MRVTTSFSEREELFRQQAQVLKALANASRLMLVDRLLHGPCPVGELNDLFASDRTTVSKHLGVLRAIGIVRDRREAGHVIYELCTPCVANVFACTRTVLEERAIATGAAGSARRGRRAPAETTAA
jgi:DNA-binding transcriptional ArsR family regulator